MTAGFDPLGSYARSGIAAVKVITLSEGSVRCVRAEVAQAGVNMMCSSHIFNRQIFLNVFQPFEVMS